MTTGIAHERRSRRPRVLALGALGMVLVVGLALFGWNSRRTEAAQITGYSADSPTTVIVAYVRGPEQSIVSASAEESGDRVILRVTLTADPLFAGSGTGRALYYSTTIALASPIGDRSVVDGRGDAIVEQPPGVIQAPRG